MKIILEKFAIAILINYQTSKALNFDNFESPNILKKIIEMINYLSKRKSENENESYYILQIIFETFFI